MTILINVKEILIMVNKILIGMNAIIETFVKMNEILGNVSKGEWIFRLK